MGVLAVAEEARATHQALSEAVMSMHKAVRHAEGVSPHVALTVRRSARSVTDTLEWSTGLVRSLEDAGF